VYTQTALPHTLLAVWVELTRSFRDERFDNF
jgi:hypothetical protein